MLSNIPPFMLYCIDIKDTDTKQLYVDMFLDSDVMMNQKASTAWMFDLTFMQDTTDSLPLAIQIELYLSFYKYLPVNLSPFTCAYYLQFLCYHRMQQCDNRDHALQQLIEVVNDIEQCGKPHTSWNIAGHCLLLAGRTGQARHMFYRSYCNRVDILLYVHTCLYTLKCVMCMHF